MDFCQIPIPVIIVGCSTAGGIDQAASTVTTSLLDAIGQAFAHAAETVLTAVFNAINATASVDLTASYVTRNAAVLATVALVIVVGLFVIQVVTAALRQEPGGLARAVTGAGTALLGTAAAATVTQTLLIAVDEICTWIAAAAGTTIEDAARQLLDLSALLQMSGTGAGSALMLLFGLLFVLGATLTLGTLLVRKALLVIAIIVAPLAFAGGTARLTSGWVRRWLQVTLALVLSKLAIVIVFVVAVGMLGDTTGIGALLSGLILLLLACLAPWACFKVLDFAGTHVASEWHHATNGATIGAVQHGRATAQSMLRTVAPVLGPVGAAVAARSGIPPQPPAVPPRVLPAETDIPMSASPGEPASARASRGAGT